MTDVILRISGMDCGACAVRIVRALQGLPGLREVSVSDTAGCARLTYDETAVDLGEIARCVQRAGFDVPVGTAELRCPGADAGAEARLRAVFGVRSVARAGDTFTVTLWPVGTDAAALPAVLGPGAELTAQRGGEETLQGRTRLAEARRAAHGADAVAAAGVCAARACGGGALRRGRGPLAQHVARAARWQPRVGCARPACGARSVCVQCVCGLRGPAAVLSRAVRHRLRAAGRKVRGAAGARDTCSAGAAAQASASAHGDGRARWCAGADGCRHAHAAGCGAYPAGRAHPGRRYRALRRLYGR